MQRKSRLMRQVEERYNQPLERLLPVMYNQMGLPRMAQVLGVSRSTVWYWLLRCGIRVERKALSEGEVLEIRKSEAPATTLLPSR